MLPAFGACCATALPSRHSKDAAEAANWTILFGICFRMAVGLYPQTASGCSDSHGEPDTHAPLFVTFTGQPRRGHARYHLNFRGETQSQDYAAKDSSMATRTTGWLVALTLIAGAASANAEADGTLFGLYNPL